MNKERPECHSKGHSGLSLSDRESRRTNVLFMLAQRTKTWYDINKQTYVLIKL